MLGPDVNESDVSFAPRSGTVLRRPGRLRDPGFASGWPPSKGVGEVAVQSIPEARNKGALLNARKLCERVDMRAVNKKVLECLHDQGGRLRLPGRQSGHDDGAFGWSGESGPVRWLPTGRARTSFAV